MTDEEFSKFVKKKNILEAFFYLGWLFFIPIMFLFEHIFKFFHLYDNNSERNIFFVWAAFWICSRVACEFLNCPNCGKNFYWGGRFRRPLFSSSGNCCSNCGLSASVQNAKGRKRTIGELSILIFLCIWCAGIFTYFIKFSIFFIHVQHAPGVVTNIVFQKHGNSINCLPEVKFSNPAGEENTLLSPAAGFQTLMPTSRG
jgi:hypothetical protein